MAKIFISYSSKNRARAHQLATMLEDDGHVVWWDHKLKGGVRFTDEIAEQIAVADKVVVIWSTDAVVSDYVVDEADRGRDKLVPVRIDNVTPPVGFGMIHTIDLRAWPKRLDEVLAAVGGPVPTGRRRRKAERARTDLTKLERLFLINQYEILSALKPKEAEHYQLMIKKLQNGYTHRLSIFDDYLYEDLPEDIHKFVFDVLEMHRAMTFSFKQLNDLTGIDERKLRFAGFDGNYETDHMAYAAYLLDDEGLYAELQRKGGYNSHHPTLEMYTSMLEAWHASRAPRELAREDIVRILNSR